MEQETQDTQWDGKGQETGTQCGSEEETGTRWDSKRWGQNSEKR